MGCGLLGMVCVVNAVKLKTRRRGQAPQKTRRVAAQPPGQQNSRVESGCLSVRNDSKLKHVVPVKCYVSNYVMDIRVHFLSIIYMFLFDCFCHFVWEGWVETGKVWYFCCFISVSCCL